MDERLVYLKTKGNYKTVLVKKQFNSPDIFDGRDFFYKKGSKIYFYDKGLGIIKTGEYVGEVLSNSNESMILSDSAHLLVHNDHILLFITDFSAKKQAWPMVIHV